jgi:DNA topoisomerase-3
MRLIVAEKPSVARDIARVVGASSKGDGFLDGDGVRVTWCVGHLVELEEPSHYDPAWRRWSFDVLPMVPTQFALRPRKDSRDQWEILRRLLRDRGVKQVVNACDAGREGELIFRYAYELAEAKAPVVRLWTSSLTDGALRAAFAALKPASAYDPLADAARSRSEADWLVGMNATRAMTCLARQGGGDELLSVGRVQTPTLAMIVGRDREIEAFVPETFFQVKARFEADGAAWDGTWFRPTSKDEPERGEDDDVPHAERISDPEDARRLAEATRGRAGRVEASDRRRREERPPLLYDLTALQRRASQRYGMSADQTLAVAQALYEHHKLITYPRTDARFLTEAEAETLPGVLRAVAQLAVYRPFAEAILQRGVRPGSRVVDASEVGDHHAILPTDKTPNPDRLSPDEKRVYDLVVRRLLAALSPDAVFELATVIVAVDADPQALPEVAPPPPRFRARGRVLVDAGWRAVDPPGKDRDRLLPNVAVGALARVASADAVEGATRPPPPHNDASILKAMETAGKQLDDDELARALRSSGLGTPATRAAILKTLIDRGYVERTGKILRATPKGRALIDAVPVEDLKSAALTGRWEKRLADMAEKRESRAAFLHDVVLHLTDVVARIAAAEPPPVASVKKADEPALGACPVCKSPVREGRATFSCETGRACTFVVFKTMSGRAISSRLVRQLLKDGRTTAVKGFKSKAGASFDAGLLLREDGSVGFWFPERDAKPASDGEGAPAVPPSRRGASSASKGARTSASDGAKSGASRARASKAPSPPPSAHPDGAAAPKAAPTDPVGLPCPRCRQGAIVKGRAAWGCSRFREGCHYLVPFTADGRPISAADAAQRVLAGR